MFRKLLMASAAAVAIFTLSSAARANTITFSGGFGATATVSNYTLNGTKFTFTITNTSSSGSITAIGFDLPGTRPNDFMIVSSTDPDFVIAQDVAAQAGAVTSEGINRGVFDFALLTGSNFGGGMVSEGIGPGQSATFTIMGDFTGLTAEQIALSLSIRFMGINPGDQSTVGEPNAPPAAVPEPATMILLGTGLAGVAARARKRRKSA